MLAVSLALLCALCYGTSDFLGGVLSARVTPWTAAFTGSITGALALAVYAGVVGGSPRLSDLGWGALAGVGGCVGITFLYRGLVRGRMGVVAPLSGVVAALVPALTGLASGERPSAVVGLGALLALPASYLVAREPASGDAAGAGSAGVLEGVAAGLGFGLSFATIAQSPSSAGQWPVVVQLLSSAVVIAAVASLLHAAWLPTSGHAALASSTGVLSALAMALFVASTHHGLLAVTGIIASLYPAATVVLAVVVLRERVHRTQVIGLALCAVAVSMVAVG